MVKESKAQQVLLHTVMFTMIYDVCPVPARNWNVILVLIIFLYELSLKVYMRLLFCGMIIEKRMGLQLWLC